MVVFITAVAAGICVLSLYSVYGNVIRHETTLHNLRCRVEQLNNDQILRLAELKGEIAPEPVQIKKNEGIELGLAEDPQADADQTAVDQNVADQSVDEELVSSSTNAA